jgi:hypothetical protein
MFNYRAVNRTGDRPTFNYPFPVIPIPSTFFVLTGLTLIAIASARY